MASTIKDVARLAGVSTATVSRVINNDPKIAPTTRQRVLDCINRTGYRVNTVARSLKTSRTRTIGFVTPEIANDFFMRIAEGAEQVLGEKGYNLVVCNSNESVEGEITRLRMLLENWIDGAILIPASHEGAHLQMLKDAGVPIVIADRKVENFTTDTVVVDNSGGAYAAVKQLLSDGARRIGFIGGDLELTTATERYEGYLKALDEAGVQPDSSIIRFGNFHFDSGYTLMKELVTHNNPPEHIFIANYFMHVGATRYLVDQSGSKAVTIAAFDDMDLSSLLGFAKVTVRQPMTDIGRECAKLLLDRIEGYSGPVKREILKTSLVFP